MVRHLFSSSLGGYGCSEPQKKEVSKDARRLTGITLLVKPCTLSVVYGDVRKCFRGMRVFIEVSELWLLNQFFVRLHFSDRFEYGVFADSLFDGRVQFDCDFNVFESFPMVSVFNIGLR